MIISVKYGRIPSVATILNSWMMLFMTLVSLILMRVMHISDFLMIIMSSVFMSCVMLHAVGLVMWVAKLPFKLRFRDERVSMVIMMSKASVHLVRSGFLTNTRTVLVAVSIFVILNMPIMFELR